MANSFFKELEFVLLESDKIEQVLIKDNNKIEIKGREKIFILIFTVDDIIITDKNKNFIKRFGYEEKEALFNYLLTESKDKLELCRDILKEYGKLEDSNKTEFLRTYSRIKNLSLLNQFGEDLLRTVAQPDYDFEANHIAIRKAMLSGINIENINDWNSLFGRELKYYINKV